MRLRDRVAVVTACGRGETYGVVWARALAREGAALVVADAEPSRAAEVAAALAAGGGRAVGTTVDVRSRESCAALVALAVERFGGLDVLVHTHHVWHDLRGDDTSDAYLRDVLDENAVSLVRMAEAAWPAMRARGGGSIVSLSSI